MTEKIKVLFLCTGNSCRSQMAEGWTRHLLGDTVEPFSAGIIAKGMNQNAVKAMKDVGVDISLQTSKTMKDIADDSIDYVFTVCSHAHDTCPVFPGEARVIHVGFDDPPQLAEDAKTEEEALSHYRRVRDEINEFVQKLPEYFDKPQSSE